MAVNVELTDQEALAFRLLSKAHAWSLRKGSATIHFDKEGTPASVEIRSWTYEELSMPIPSQHN